MKIFKTAKWYDKLKGGKADGKEPDDFDKDQLEKGKNVEKEHTTDEDTATEIAMDHLEESDDKKDKKGGKYYDKLDDMEKEIEKEKKASIYFDLMKFAKKKGKAKNEYALCTTSIGGKEGTQERSKWDQDAKDRYGRCLKDINPAKHKPKKKKSGSNKNIKIASGVTKFEYNMPAEIDPAETAIIITYFYSPAAKGTGRDPLDGSYPEPAMVEDIHAYNKMTGEEIEVPEESRLENYLEEACWENAEKTVRPDDDRDYDDDADDLGFDNYDGDYDDDDDLSLI